MTITLQVGDKVVLNSIPDWLVRDLPESEKQEILACVGSATTIDSIDDNGYHWIGFGSTIDAGDNAEYSGHSFCVPRECLTKVEAESL